MPKSQVRKIKRQTRGAAAHTTVFRSYRQRFGLWKQMQAAVLSLTLVVTSAAIFAPQTRAAFVGQDTIEGHSITTGILDFELELFDKSPSLPENSNGIEPQKYVRVINNGTVNFQYIVQAEMVDGDDDFCSILKVRAINKDHGLEDLPGPLLELNAGPVVFSPEGDLWLFVITWPHNNINPNVACLVRLVFTGWQENLEQGLGFSDQEFVQFVISAPQSQDEQEPEQEGFNNEQDEHNNNGHSEDEEGVGDEGQEEDHDEDEENKENDINFAAQNFNSQTPPVEETDNEQSENIEEITEEPNEDQGSEESNEQVTNEQSEPEESSQTEDQENEDIDNNEDQQEENSDEDTIEESADGQQDSAEQQNETDNQTPVDDEAREEEEVIEQIVEPDGETGDQPTDDDHAREEQSTPPKEDPPSIESGESDSGPQDE